MVTQDRLKELFRYDPETGNFLRIKGVRKAAAGVIAGTKALNGYITISVDCKRYYAHRLAWLYMHGSMPVQIDHKDRIRDNNIFSNLRAADNSTNNANRISPRMMEKRAKGVKMLPSGRYAASIKAGGVTRHIGVYATELDAAAAYDKEARSRFGEFAVLNDGISS